MFNEDDFRLKIKAIADNVPEQFGKRLSDVMHWVVSQAFIQHFQPHLVALEDRIKELENGNETGGLQESQGNHKAAAKAPRRREE